MNWLAFALLKSFYRLPVFNDYGLHWSISLLNSRQIKPLMLKMDVVQQAEFADAVTVGQTQHDPAWIGKMIDDTNIIRWNHTNATGIGNIAYISLHHPDRFVCAKAKLLLAQAVAVESAFASW